MSIRWLVPMAAATVRRLTSAVPCAAKYAIAASSSRTRASPVAPCAVVMYHMVHVPTGTEEAPMEFETAVEIDAPASAVWDTMTAVEAYPTWTETMTTVERLDAGPLAI